MSPPRNLGTLVRVAAGEVGVAWPWLAAGILVDAEASQEDPTG
jgi:hypothetical protein